MATPWKWSSVFPPDSILIFFARPQHTHTHTPARTHSPSTLLLPTLAPSLFNESLHLLNFSRGGWHGNHMGRAACSRTANSKFISEMKFFFVCFFFSPHKQKNCNHVKKCSAFVRCGYFFGSLPNIRDWLFSPRTVLVIYFFVCHSWVKCMGVWVCTGIFWSVLGRKLRPWPW